MSSLEGKVAVVTGAARGMGREFAVRLASQGASIALVDILDTAETLQEVRRHGRDGISLEADITQPQVVRAAAQKVASGLGGAHILINNAGLHPHPTPFEELTFEYWRKTLSINLDSMFLLIQAFLPQMKARGWGRIVNLSSAAANAAPPMGAPYVASKCGVVGLTRAVATEVGRHNITVNAIAPNPVRTPGAEGGAVSEEMFQSIAALQPVPRVMEPRDVAGMVAFLCSDDAAFITGQHLHVDGGFIRGD
ncbi:MAG TPA: SDR family oxidoreductase [Steroidobacteraceae bacterium]|nr:SDR family oxidoreductase [Steroidobacteraceae bacterium]